MKNKKYNRSKRNDYLKERVWWKVGVKIAIAMLVLLYGLAFLDFLRTDPTVQEIVFGPLNSLDLVPGLIVFGFVGVAIWFIYQYDRTKLGD